jgi:hypothetical protein
LSDRTWEFLGIFFAVTSIIGGFGLVYYADKNNLEPFFGNATFKYAVIIYGLVASFIVVHSEVRKRVETKSIYTVWTTLVAMLVIFAYLALTRL